MVPTFSDLQLTYENNNKILTKQFTDVPEFYTYLPFFIQALNIAFCWEFVYTSGSMHVGIKVIFQSVYGETKL